MIASASELSWVSAGQGTDIVSHPIIADQQLSLAH